MLRQNQYEPVDAADKLDTDTVVEEIHEEAKQRKKKMKTVKKKSLKFPLQKKN